MSTYSDVVADEFKRILRERKLSVCGAARALGVTRQAFHNYLNGKSVPRPTVMGQAMDLWDFNIKIGDVSLDRSSFPKRDESVQRSEQLTFLETWDSIRQQDMKIAVKRVGSTLKVEVNIDIPA